MMDRSAPSANWAGECLASVGAGATEGFFCPTEVEASLGDHSKPSLGASPMSGGYAIGPTKCRPERL